MVERSDTTGYEIELKAAGTPAGVQEFLVMTFSGGVVAGVPQPPATGCDASGIVSIKSVIYDREEYINRLFSIIPRANQFPARPSGKGLPDAWFGQVFIA